MIIKKTVLTVSALSLLSSFVYANQKKVEGSFILKKDFEHNGVLMNETTTDFILQGFHSHFIATATNKILSGDISANEKIIRFEINDLISGKSQFYSGHKSEGGGYQGSWHGEDGSFGDWGLVNSQQDVFTTCKQILDSGMSNGDGVYEIVDDNNQPISVYCDMTSHDGGWTLVGAYPSTSAGGIRRINEYGSVPETNPTNPTSLWLYQGSLARFTDAKEQIACPTGQKCNSNKEAFANNLSMSELELVRYSWGYLDRVDNMPKLINTPSCRTNYFDVSTHKESCVNPDYLKWNDTVYRPTYQVGWQLDLYGSTHCWVARGEYLPGGRGSTHCRTNAEPNGTTFALLWMR